MLPEVDLVVNTFERSYRRVLAPGFIESIVRANRARFARRTALINNVADPADAEAMADALVAAGEIDAYRTVAAELDRALALTGLSREDLGRIPHYTDCSLVAVTMDGPPKVLYWDADVTLEQPHDWVTPAAALLDAEPGVLVTNPRWTRDEDLGKTTIFTEGSFAFGRGFSDQVYLVRRADFRAPIYSQHCASRLRFPMSAVNPIFEARVDAHMRHRGLLRGTYLGARYVHPVQASGTATETMTARERARHARNRLVLAAISASPVKRRCWRYM